MHIQNFSNNVSFQKTLKANCNILKDGNNQQCSIYQLDPIQDRDFFQKLEYENDWGNNEYVSCMNDIMQTIQEDSKESVYELETQEGKCLGYLYAEEKRNAYEIGFIESIPKNKYGTNYKYIGETLLSFIAKLARIEEKERIFLAPADSAVDFYENKCHFSTEEDSEEQEMILPNDRYNKLISQNENHTGKNIDVLS